MYKKKNKHRKSKQHQAKENRPNSSNPSIPKQGTVSVPEEIDPSGAEDRDELRLLNPGTAPMVIMVLTASLLAAFAAPYVADPTSVPAPWKYVTSAILGFAFWGAASSISCASLPLVFLRRLSSARTLFQHLGAYASIGAILGTLLGLRILLSSHWKFAEYMNTLGGVITMFTVFALAFCWFHSAILLFSVRDEFVADYVCIPFRHPLSEAAQRRVGTIAAWGSLIAGNSLGASVGLAVFQMLI